MISVLQRHLTLDIERCDNSVFVCYFFMRFLIGGCDATLMDLGFAIMLVPPVPHILYVWRFKIYKNFKTQQLYF